MGWPQLLIAFATNCMVAMLSAFGIRSILPGRRVLSDFHGALVYVLVAAVTSPAICALGGAFVRIAGEGSMEDYGVFWQQWYFANALASLTLGATILTWMDAGEDWKKFANFSRLGEALLVSVGLIATCIVAFKVDGRFSHDFQPAILYAPLALILWAAVQFGVVGGSAAVLLVTIASIVLTLDGPTIFMHAAPEDNVLSLQVFLTALAVPILLLAASIDGMRRAEQVAAALANLVLGDQDDVRRHVAKSLHEHIGQNIVAATWIAERIYSKLPPEQQPTAKQLVEALQESTRDLRSLSYLLHPPLLEEGGLSPALQALAESHAQRYGIAVELKVSDSVGRFSPRLELAAFRLVEEALESLPRVPGSPSPRVNVDRKGNSPGNNVILTVEGVGHGEQQKISGGTAALDKQGLAFARIRERLRSIGGVVEINLDVGRLVINATIPIAE